MAAMNSCPRHATPAPSCPQCRMAMRDATQIGANGLESSTNRFSDQPSLDDVFVWLSDKGDASASQTLGPTSLTSMMSGMETTRSDVAFHSAEVPVERVWVQQEKERFAQYTASQFAALHRQRQELATVQSKMEAAAVTREQELNRRQVLLGARAEVLARGEKQFEDRERDLKTREARAVDAERKLEHVLEARSRIVSEVAELNRELERQRAEIENAASAIERSRQEHSTLREELRVLEDEKARGLALIVESDRRMEAVEKAERNLQRRMKEVEQFEAEIQLDLERRDRDLRQREKELKQFVQQARDVEATESPEPAAEEAGV